MARKRQTQATKLKRLARSAAQRRETIYIVPPTARHPRNRMFLANGTEIRGVAVIEATYEPHYEYVEVTSIHDTKVERARLEVQELRITLARPKIIHTAKRPPRK